MWPAADVARLQSGFIATFLRPGFESMDVGVCEVGVLLVVHQDRIIGSVGPPGSIRHVV